MTRRVACALVVIVFLASRVFAQQNPHAVQPERPTVATHAGTVATGWFEIETGGERDQLAGATSWLTPTVLKLGIASNAQLSVFASTSDPAQTSVGIGDTGVGVKWRLLDDAPVVGDFAVLPAVKLPTGNASQGQGTGTTDIGFLLISSHDFGVVDMDLNVGYTRRSGNGTQAPKNATLWTASFGGPAVGKLGWVAEMYGYPRTTGPAGQPSIVALLAGPTFTAKDWLALDTGVIIPLTGPQPHAVYAGLVWNVGKVW
jgi:hypothetical protein